MKSFFKIFRTKWFRSAPVVATIFMSITATNIIVFNYFFQDLLFHPMS
ncbi:Photosystem I reaction center subunit IX [Prochlorococcus marinus]|nr:Photosystem I reaction center subunit IX [Prochlorococcus marinus]